MRCSFNQAKGMPKKLLLRKELCEELLKRDVLAIFVVSVSRIIYSESVGEGN
jgi:hypothetical protein